MEQFEATGHCLCGKVKFVAKKAIQSVGACHCGMCRQWGGGPYMAVACGNEVVFEGENNISVYDRGDWAERGFCNKCGSHLFYRLKETKQHMIPAGLFDDQSKFILDHQVFIDKKPDFYKFINETNDLTEAEVFARYSPR